MIRRVQQPGFTLLELILVMMIICIVLGIASPSLRGWSKESALRNAAEDLLTTARLARTQAITTGKTHRLCIPLDGGYYLMVLEGTEFVPVPSDFGFAPDLALNFRIELAKDPLAGMDPRLGSPSGMGASRSRLGDTQDMLSSSASDQPCIDFFATGRTEPARIRVVSELSGSIEIACASPAEPFEIVTTGAGY
jgi:prepilin-type N-terminal cleavage/methylation domain-containing protein